jgi:hypothetical protein
MPIIAGIIVGLFVFFGIGSYTPPEHGGIVMVISSVVGVITALGFLIFDELVRIREFLTRKFPTEKFMSE